jgi:hypothetical protein
MPDPRRIDWEDPTWRGWRVENIRRSLAMLNEAQGSGLSRDDAYRLVVELQQIDGDFGRSDTNYGGWPANPTRAARATLCRSRGREGRSAS